MFSSFTFPKPEFKKVASPWTKGDNTITLRDVADYQNLKTIQIDGFRLTDAETLKECASLQVLVLKNCGLDSLDFCAALKALKNLQVEGNHITSIEPLKLLNLEVLNVSKNKISSLEPIAHHTNLTELQCADNLLSRMIDLTPFSELKVLNFSNNAIPDLQCVAKLRKLTKLYAANNQIDTVEPLENLTRLAILDLKRNRIRKIKSLKQLDMLEQVGLSGNPLDDDDLNELKRSIKID